MKKQPNEHTNDESQSRNANNEIPLEKILDKKLNPIDKKLEDILTWINFLSAKYDELVKKLTPSRTRIRDSKLKING
jgi:hypothetical protein